MFRKVKTCSIFSNLAPVLSLLNVIFFPSTDKMILNFSEKKFSTSGEYYQHEVTYTTPGMIAEDYNQKLSKAGAMVLTAKGGRKIVIHKNDLYQNAQLKINTNISPDKTQIKLSTNSINPL